MHLPDFEIAIDEAETPEALWSAFRGYFHGTIVQRVSYLHLPPLGAPDHNPDLHTAGFPETATARYMEERLYRDNPVLSRAQRRVEAVYWDEVLEDEGLDARERAFVAEFRAFNLGNGVGIPVFGPNGRRGQCGLGFAPEVYRLDPPVLRDFQRICQLIHLRYCALILPMLGPLPALSQREREVLAWVARGKSNSLIGEILGISGNTVDAHLRRVYLKLGVFDRISAAVRGIGIGLIHAET